MSIKSKIKKDENVESVPYLEITEVVDFNSDTSLILIAKSNIHFIHEGKDFAFG